VQHYLLLHFNIFYKELNLFTHDTIK